MKGAFIVIFVVGPCHCDELFVRWNKINSGVLEFYRV